MQIRTVIIPKIPKKTKADNKDIVVYVIMLLAEIVVNTFLPFIEGFFLCYTQNLFWLILLMINIIFNIRVELTNNRIEIKIIRGF